MTTFLKDPDATLDYKVDWTAWLTDGETITDVSWEVPEGLTQGVTSGDGVSATIWLSGGTLGSRPGVVCHITTTAGRSDDRTLPFLIIDR